MGGRRLGWGEAARLVQQLLTDPTSHLAAAANAWDRPVTVETLMLADLYDLTAAINTAKGRRPQPHPIRPWKSRQVERYHDTGGKSRAEVEALLAHARKGFRDVEEVASDGGDRLQVGVHPPLGEGVR